MAPETTQPPADPPDAPCKPAGGTIRFDARPDQLGRSQRVAEAPDLREAFLWIASEPENRQLDYGTAGSADSAIVWWHFCGCAEVQSKASHKFRAAGRHAVIEIVTLGRSRACN